MWMVSAALVLAVAVLLHAIFPRYELMSHGAGGDAVVVFDRWTGQFQRAIYGADGEPRTSAVVRPF
jgi:hypothetical protein